MRKISLIILICFLMTMLSGISIRAAVDFNTMPIPKADTTLNGYYIVKTMYLLETSTAEHPNTVRIAVTGQSISDTNNTWPADLVSWLRTKYPTANIVFKNFAIGGFASSTLYKRVPNDISSFFPDLVILYDYGDQNLIERMIKYCREVVGAEVMLQTYHYTGPNSESDSMSFGVFPDMASRNNSDLCQIRDVWKKFLDNNNLQASELLLDGVHLNANGQHVMLEFMKQFFVYRPSNAEEVLASQTRTVNQGDWVAGKLTIPFKGVRAEVIPGSGLQSDANVTIDSKKPSEFKEAYIRSAESLGMWDTNLGIIKYNSVPGEQTWTIEVADFSSTSAFEIKASGSATGSEGTSVNSILNGPHLRLDYESFIWDITKPTVGKTYTFRSILNGCDVYSATKNVLVSGIPNVSHTLVLQAANPSSPPDIKAIKIFDPSVIIKSDTPRPNTVVPNRPEVYDINDSSRLLGGYAFDQGTITITIGSTKYTTTIDKNGDWKKWIPKPLKANTKISVTITVDGVKSLPRVIYVQASPPAVYKTTSKSTYIGGKTYPKAKVFVKISGKTKTVLASSKGVFKLKLTKKLKKGSFFYVKAAYLTRTSAQLKVKVY